MKTPDYTKNAVRKYQKKLTTVVIRFNPESESDQSIIDFLSGCKNKTAMIKKSILDHMESNQ